MPSRWFKLFSRNAEASAAGIQCSSAQTLQDRLADYGEALALAEAGEQLLAGAIIRREGAGKKRLLAVGHHYGFSARLAYYAISLASRMDAAVTFLNVSPADAPASETAAFHTQATLSASYWLQAASARGVSADHVVALGTLRLALEQVARQAGRVELVLSEPEESALLAGHMGLALFTVE